MAAEEKKLAKRIKLIEAAYDLFTGKGINLTAIDEVVKLAGVAKGTFYLYFKDKYDLLDQIIISKSEGVLQKALEELEKQNSEKTLSPADKLIYFSDSIVSSLIRNRRLVSLIQKNLSAFHTLILSGTDTRLGASVARLEEIFISGGFSREDAEKYLYILTAALGSVSCDCVLSGKPYSIDEVKPCFHYIIKSIFRE